MNLKFFILGLCVLVSIAQISTAQQSQEGPEDDDSDAPEQEEETEDPTEDEIEQRRKITSIMNSAVNIVEPETIHRQDIYTQQMQNTNMGYMVQPQPVAPPPTVGSPIGGLLGTLFDLGSKLLPLLKPLWDLFKTALPVLKELLVPVLKAITKALPLIPKLIEFVKPLLALLPKIAKYLIKLFDCLKTILGMLLKGFKFLLKGLKTLYNLLPVIPQFLDLIPSLIESLWRIWHSLRYVILYPVRSFQRWLRRIVHFFYAVPSYLVALMSGIAHFLASPLQLLGVFLRRVFHVFNNYIIIPVASLKYFLGNLYHVLLGPLEITRHFLEELACLFVKTPIRVFRSIMREIFVNGILNTIRYIKTVIYEVIVFPWSHHYADMFPSLGNRHNYILPNQLVCQGTAC